jgi:hypothetical protein
LKPGEWHTPFALGGPLHMRLITSPARCTRVSYYLPEDGTLSTFERDKETYGKLADSEPIHASPFEHAACATEGHAPGEANYKGFQQLRYYVENKLEV